MAVTMSAQLDQWVASTRQRSNAVFREAAQDFVSIAQTVGPSVANPDSTGGGNLPVDTGFLRSSLVASTDSAPLPTRSNPFPSGKKATDFNSGQVSLVILGAEIGQTLHIGYTANYAMHAENKYGFVRLAAAQWPEIVRKATVKAKNVVLNGFARLSE